MLICKQESRGYKRSFNSSILVLPIYVFVILPQWQQQLKESLFGGLLLVTARLGLAFLGFFAASAAIGQNVTTFRVAFIGHVHVGIQVEKVHWHEFKAGIDTILHGEVFTSVDNQPSFYWARQRE